MSLPSEVNTEKSKHQTAAMKEAVQRSGEVYYGMGPPALKPSHNDPASSSGVYNPEKGTQSHPQYQQSAQVKWMQDPIQASNWSQEAPVPAWGQNFGPYMSGVNVRGQMAFHKGVHEAVAMPMGGENQLPAPVDVYRDATQAQAQGRGLEWDQHAAAAMHQAKLQAYQHGHTGVELQGQPHVSSHTLQGPMLQPFQASFRPNKQQFSSGYYSVFPGSKPMPNLAYSEQPKTQQQLLHQMKQQQIHHHHQQQQQQQQQQLHQQHQLQLQQQHLQQQQQQHQMQQQQQMQQMQQQYHQQHLQERQQQIQQIQQLQQQNVPQHETSQPQVQAKQQQTQNFGAYQSPGSRPPDTGAKKEDIQSVEPQLQPEAQASDAPAVLDPCPEKVTMNPAESADAAPAAPRRSRRLSREGQSPLGPPSTNIWSQASKEPSQNGVAGVPAAKGGEGQAATGGVIQITRRRRRASKEINLETLAQKASEMESLPAKTAKQEEGPSGKQAAIMPLVIPVSVPVHRSPADSQGCWDQARLGQGERSAGEPDRKPSVIVARRRSLRNSASESFEQDGENDPGLDEEGKAKIKRRPRPEPLIIPLPKPSTFIAPSVYSSITSYQSNLRSPVRLPDNPHALPPYTPPPILSPVRTGTGLYFSTFLTNIAVSNQILPPPATPKSATRSLLRSSSSEITPPVLPLIADATPASLEPRINIGQHYQAEIPDLQEPLSSQFDLHKADLVWLPKDDSSLKHGDQESMVDLMNMACSSVFRGGGTNQELVLHCLHECGGNFLETLERLMLQDPIFPKGHHLSGYHYSGSDNWTPEEKCYFNKGISAYRKDFFMVQKLVQTKTVAQCVEFYYTYKKQVKIGRNGILTFGPPDSPMEKHTEAVMDVKSSQLSKLIQGEAVEEDKKDVSYDESHMSSQQARVARSLQVHDYAGTEPAPDTVSKEPYHSSVPYRHRAEPAAKKAKAPVKPPQDPDAVFPCKKCNRVFYKVKSRSAHMKSHAEQEKKAAALRQKELEEQAAAQARARKAAAAAAAVAAHQGGNGNGETQQAEVSSQEDSSEGGEDDDDEDWH